MIDLQHEIKRELSLIDPPDLWDRIQADASNNRDVVADLTTARHRRRSSRWLAAAAVTVLLALVGALALLDDHQSVDTTPVTDVPVAPEPPTNDDRSTTLAKGEGVQIVGLGGLPGQTGYALTVDAVEQAGEVTGELRVNDVVVTLQCAGTGFGGRDLILGGEVTEDPDGGGLVTDVGDATVSVGDRLALIIREADPDSQRVTLYADVSAGSCTELVESVPFGLDGGFFDYIAGGAIETNLLLSTTPTCEEWTAREVTADEVESGCSDGDFLPGTSVTECTDGRVLYQNFRVWGYVGEPAHAHEDGARTAAPDAERQACGY